MKVSLDGSRCQGHGRCHLVSPDIFDLAPFWSSSCERSPRYTQSVCAPVT